MQPLDSSAAESGTKQARSSRRGAVAIIIALLAVLALFSLPPHDPLDKADRFAYAVCHRIPDHSFSIGGRQLPLCARCSGTYLGALAGIVVLLALGRGRANRFPAPKFLVAFGIFMAAWAIDGANSYASFFPGLPQLYEPNNLLRLATGVLEGLVIAAFVLPLFNMTAWAATECAALDRPLARFGLAAAGRRGRLRPCCQRVGAVALSAGAGKRRDGRAVGRRDLRHAPVDDRAARWAGATLARDRVPAPGGVWRGARRSGRDRPVPRSPYDMVRSAVLRQLSAGLAVLGDVPRGVGRLSGKLRLDDRHRIGGVV